MLLHKQEFAIHILNIRDIKKKQTWKGDLPPFKSVFIYLAILLLHIPLVIERAVSITPNNCTRLI
jgi:hypothetical protein